MLSTTALTTERRGGIRWGAHTRSQKAHVIVMGIIGYRSWERGNGDGDGDGAKLLKRGSGRRRMGGILL
jgi:hypothetical protein